MLRIAQALIVLLIPLSALAALDVVPCDAPPILDGVLDDPCWSVAVPLDLSWEIDPGDRTPAAVATTCLVTHDNGALYVAFRALDPEPDRIRANLAERDDGFDDDWVGVVVDPFADRRRGFQFLVSAGGVQMDLTRSETAAEPDDAAWDAVWSSAAAVDSTGYCVEIAVPFSSLRYEGSDEPAVWGFLGFRHHPRSVARLTCSSPIDPDEDCELCMATDLRGFAGISAGRNLELTPTYTASRTDERAPFPDGDMHSGRPVWDLGLSARWGPTPNTSIDAALNPDFSQVEADELQLDVNTRWALEYEEKRPVFLEGADLFETYQDAVYTRMVVDPDWVAKVSGKEGANAFGAFAARDRWTNMLIYEGGRSRMETLERENTSAAARWRRDVGEGSTVGALLTARDADGYRNIVGGLDAVVRPGGGHELDVQALVASTSLDAGTAAVLGGAADLDDTSVSMIYSRDGRLWSWLAGWQRTGRDFRADLGFLPRVDMEQRDLGVWRSWWREAGKGVHFIGAGVHGTEVRDIDGTLTDRELRAELNVMGPMQSRLWLATDLLRERFAGTDFDQTIIRGKAGFRPHDALWAWVMAWGGDDIDYYNARSATSWGAGPGVTWTPTPRVSVIASHVRYALDAGGGRMLTVDQTDARFQFALSSRSHLRWTVQLEDVALDTDRFPFPVLAEDRTLFSQFLYSFRANPRTVLFLGTTDRRLGDEVTELTVHDRTWFLKVGYAWRP